LRRLYEFATSQAQAHATCQNELNSFRERYADLEGKAKHWTSEKEALELQLYVMRSDQQRAAARNALLSAKLNEATSSSLNNLELMDLCGRILQHVESLSGGGDLLYAKLAGRLTMLSSEISRLRPEYSRENGAGVELYLDLLEASLTGTLFEDKPIDPWTPKYDSEVRAIGRDWPATALTMIGSARLRNLRVLAQRVLAEDVPGDMLEAGVWRGGACILLRGLLAVHGVRDRRVWVADSFSGLPPPDPKYAADAGDIHSTYEALAVPLDAVQANFRRYGLLDDQVGFLKGWFSETLPSAPIEALSLLRLDGDMYSSTIETLDALYSKVSVGGYIIVDDYILKGCREAIHDFRRRESIDDELHDVDGAAIYWRKSR